MAEETLDKKTSELESLTLAEAIEANAVVPVAIPNLGNGNVALEDLAGQDGANGKSAYEVAVDNGFEGTETQWLASLKGEKGDKGDTGATGPQGPAGSYTAGTDIDISNGVISADRKIHRLGLFEEDDYLRDLEVMDYDDVTHYAKATVLNMRQAYINQEYFVLHNFSASKASGFRVLCDIGTGSSGVTEFRFGGLDVNGEKTARLCMNPDGSATDALYEYDPDNFVVNETATTEDVEEAVDTLKTRSVYTMDIGAIDNGVQFSGLSGTGIRGSLFSPSMNFQLKVGENATNLVFGNTQIGTSDKLIFAIYEFKRTVENGTVYERFEWVCNTADVSSLVGSSGSTGLHSTPITQCRDDKTLYSGKLYYIVMYGRWNSVSFVGNSYSQNFNTSIKLGIKLDNLQTGATELTLKETYPALDIAADGSGALIQGEDTVRLFAAITNATI